jgi:hypothetical protein
MASPEPELLKEAAAASDGRAIPSSATFAAGERLPIPTRGKPTRS